MAAGRRARDERGETLLELLVAITILSVCVVAIGAGIALSVRVSALHRSQATAGAYLRGYAEAIQATVPVGYTDCASTYTVSYSTPGFTPSVIGVRYWNGSAFQAACPGTDLGLQQLTIQVSGQRATEQLAVVVRKP